MDNCKVLSVNISREKGTIKEPQAAIRVDKQGVIGDAHAGDWHRQVSLLAGESIQRFEKIMGRKIAFGEFAENITTTGIILHTLEPGTRLSIGDTILEVTQIGKKCHGSNCQIFQQVGKCVMPTEGIFAKVIQEGSIKASDNIEQL